MADFVDFREEEEEGRDWSNGINELEDILQEDEEGSFGLVLMDGERALFGFIEENSVVGCLWGGICERVGHAHVYVKETHRKRGYGTQMFAAFMKDCTEKVNEIEIEVGSQDGYKSDVETFLKNRDFARSEKENVWTLRLP